jgi:hypothetical protein
MKITATPARILLGHELGTNTPVFTNQWDRRQSMYVIGKTGQGKSVFLSKMAIQDIQIGMGVWVIDPSGGDLLDLIIPHIPPNREGDVIYLNPLDTEFPFPLNLFYCPDPSSSDLFQATVEQVVAVFSKIWGMSVETPRLNQYVRNLALAIIGTPYTMLEIPKILLDKSFRTQVIQHPNDFWKAYDRLPDREQLDRSESTLDRIDSLITNKILYNIVGQSDMLNIREMMDSQKIILINLPRRHPTLSSRWHLECCVTVGRKQASIDVRQGQRVHMPSKCHFDDWI